MIITQIAELSDTERRAVEQCLGICDQLADVAHCGMQDVFNYFIEESDITGINEYQLKDTIQIGDIYG